jgi:hypothetical protein
MSLDDMHRRAVRRIKKRDAALAKKGTTAGKEELKRQDRIAAATSLSAAQFNTPDPAKDAYQPEAREGIVCPKGCGTRIIGSLNDIRAHNAEKHPE